MSRQLAASWTRGRALPAGTVAAQLPGLLGVSVDWLFPSGAAASDDEAREGADGRSSRGDEIQERGSYAKRSTGVGLAAWLALGAEMQQNVAVKVIKEALEAQDFAGSPVLRALHGIAEKMNEMGYTAMSRHIWAEMGKYFGQQLPPEE